MPLEVALGLRRHPEAAKATSCFLPGLWKWLLVALKGQQNLLKPAEAQCQGGSQHLLSQNRWVMARGSLRMPVSEWCFVILFALHQLSVTIWWEFEFLLCSILTWAYLLYLGFKLPEPTSEWQLCSWKLRIPIHGCILRCHWPFCLLILRALQICHNMLLKLICPLTNLCSVPRKGK